MGPRELARHVPLDAATEAVMKSAIERLGLSARAYHRVLKLARTLADLAGSDQVTAAQVAEAIQYRVLDRGREGMEATTSCRRRTLSSPRGPDPPDSRPAGDDGF
jgi:Mg-chelatase subunit ChlI